MKKKKQQQNRFHHHEVKLLLYNARIKHLTTPNQQIFSLASLHMILQITLTSPCDIVAPF